MYKLWYLDKASHKHKVISNSTVASLFKYNHEIRFINIAEPITVYSVMVNTFELRKLIFGLSLTLQGVMNMLP